MTSGFAKEINGTYKYRPATAVAVTVIKPGWIEDGKTLVLLRFRDTAEPLKWVGLEYFVADPDPAEKKG
jgi:hypothetical protein